MFLKYEKFVFQPSSPAPHPAKPLSFPPQLPTSSLLDTPRLAIRDSRETPFLHNSVVWSLGYYCCYFNFSLYDVHVLFWYFPVQNPLDLFLIFIPRLFISFRKNINPDVFSSWHASHLDQFILSIIRIDSIVINLVYFIAELLSRFFFQVLDFSFQYFASELKAVLLQWTLVQLFSLKIFHLLLWFLYFVHCDQKTITDKFSTGFVDDCRIPF